MTAGRERGDPVGAVRPPSCRQSGTMSILYRNGAITGAFLMEGFMDKNDRKKIIEEQEKRLAAYKEAMGRATGKKED